MALANLTFHEAAKVWVLRACDWKIRDMQARYDVDPRRLYEVWEEVEHAGSRQRGMRIFQRLFPDAELAGRFDVHKPRYRRTLSSIDAPRLPGF